MAAVDAALADQVRRWGALSIAKTEQAIDALVDYYDPGALRRSREDAAARTVEFGSPSDVAGTTSMWARLYAPDAMLIKQRVEEMARSVCDRDPRSVGERRADVLTALAAGTELACQCGELDCAAGQSDNSPIKNAVVYVVAEAATVDAATPAAKEAEPQQCAASPAFVMGARILPTPLLAATLDRATIREVHHAGDTPPEPRYPPSRALAEFVRCRDLTCRFPGCDPPATHCDVDATVPYPVGAHTPVEPQVPVPFSRPDRRVARCAPRRRRD